MREGWGVYRGQQLPPEVANVQGFCCISQTPNTSLDKLPASGVVAAQVNAQLGDHMQSSRELTLDTVTRIEQGMKRHLDVFLTGIGERGR